jgi:hypothetical protein
MAITEKMTDEELALLEIIEDPIWFGEFLRSTSDGEPDKALHPPKIWEYRDYQKQFLSDESEFILYTGGRAIGKCQPSSARIYTTEGYKRISELLELPVFGVYAISPQGELEQRRAIVRFDKRAPVYRIKTQSGHVINATENHPILTPEGYKLVALLEEGDYVGVATQLPHESTQNMFSWHELRILGYNLLEWFYTPTKPIKPRFKKIGAEFESIADRMLMTWRKDRLTGEYRLLGKRGPFKHPINQLLSDLGILEAMRDKGIRRIPAVIKNERKDNLRVLIESLFARYGTLEAREVSINVYYPKLAEDVQELLLRFGVETKMVRDGRKYVISTLDYRAAYRFWQEFNIPGVSVGELRQPAPTLDATPYMRFEPIISKQQVTKNGNTYAIHVYDYENYISDNVFVHNSVVLEDKLVWEIVNRDIAFPVTQESVLVTPNQAQMTPLLTKIILRFTSSKFLRQFLNNNINRSEGTMKFFLKELPKPMIFNFRIAGSKGENNMVKVLHV